LLQTRSDQGKLKEAEEMYWRALKGKEKAWGPEHTSTLDTVNNLGNLYSDQGKLAEAEEMYFNHWFSIRPGLQGVEPRPHEQCGPWCTNVTDDHELLSVARIFFL
jgi:hypothetical protein